MTSGMDESLPSSGDDILTFGPFLLSRTRRMLLKDGVPLPVGSRAIAILIALTENVGEILSNRELLQRVWPHNIVEEGTVRVHIALLRRALREADPKVEYVQNVTGRGYRFVAPVSPQRALPLWKDVKELPVSSPTVLRLPVRQPSRKNNLPHRLTPIIGREESIRTLADRVALQRFVTITGPGGSGKTTVAVGVADTLAGSYAHGVCFVDLASVTEQRLVASALASALGVAPLAEDPLPDVLAYLSKQSLLIILDNCEHVIEESARLAERVLRGAPQVHVLATSREPLRAVSESVYDLEPLDVPTPESVRSRVQLLNFSAIQLFVERAGVYADTELDDDDLRLVAEICQRLAGNPLAIEITAAHVRLLGMKVLAASMKNDLYLTIGGRRTAARRHQTLRATFDWSYGLLSPTEQTVFRRLSVFVGGFDLDCAVAVVASPDLTYIAVFESLMSLARKSLIVADAADGKVLYRLLDLPHAYAREKLRDANELTATQHRHAQMWCTVGAAQIQAHVQQRADWASIFGPRMQDLRAATRWCFSSASSSSLSTKLTLSSLWFEFVLVAESVGQFAWKNLYTDILRSSEGALLSRLEDVLENVRVRNEAGMREITVVQQIALGETEQKVALWSLWFERAIKRDYRIAINLSEAACQRGARSRAHAAPLMDRMLAVAHHYAGEQALACQHAEWALNTPDTTVPAGALASLQQCHTRTILARSLWLRGFADQALAASLQSVAEARHAGNPRLLCMTLLVATAVATWCGNTVEAKFALMQLQEESAAHSLEYHQLWADCLQEILIKPAGGSQVLEPLQFSADPVRSSQYLDVLGSLREHLVSTDSIVRAESGRGGWCTSEILRVKAERLLRENAPNSTSEAEALLQAALETARRQGALSWELRVAMSLARLWRELRMPRPQDLLAAVYDRFTEGFDTADLKAARQLLKELAAREV